MILTLLFCATPAWRLHVDRGQSYILYTSLFFLFAWLGRKPRKLGGQVLEGFTGSLLMGLRPIFFGQFALPWDRRRWTTLVAGIAGAALLAILPVLAFGPSIWSQYHKGMEEHARLYLEQAEQSNEATAFPGKVEGIPFDQLSRFADIPFGDTSLYKLVSFDLPSKPLLVLWALLMFGSGFWLLHRCPGQPTLLAWAVAAWANIGDFLLPAFRNIYNDVLFLPLLLLGLAVLKEGKPRTWWLMSCLVFVLSHLTLRFVPKGFIPIPSVIGLIMAIGAIGWTFYVARQATPDEKGKSSDPPGNLTKA
ncbi:MAG: glycosyltransferase 87 family protein [Verrucomicrobiota bacterium]